VRIDNSLAADRVYGAPAKWVCSHHCGYELNFCPDHYLYGVAYLPKPNPKATKELPPILENGP
jgi:hypothetical protein